MDIAAAVASRMPSARSAGLLQIDVSWENTASEIYGDYAKTEDSGEDSEDEGIYESGFDIAPYFTLSTD